MPALRARNLAIRRPYRPFVGAGSLAVRGATALMAVGAKRRMTKVRESRKKRRTARPNSVVGRLPAYRVGPTRGKISAKKKPLKARGCQMRVTKHGNILQEDKIWIGGCTIGQVELMTRHTAYTLLRYYLPKMNDYRTFNDANPDVETYPTSGHKFFSFYKLVYRKDQAETNEANPDERAGLHHLNSNLNAMATDLGTELFNQAVDGYYPVQISFAGLRQGPSEPTDVLVDRTIARVKIDMSLQSRFRFANITKAGDGETGDANANNVDANPISGRIYHFGHSAPLFRDDYTRQVADSTTTAGIEELNNANLTGQKCIGIGANHKGGDAFIHLEAPPLNPRAIWKNVKSVGSVAMSPGGYQVYNTSFRREMTLSALLKALIRVDMLQGTGRSSANYPTLGDSFVMCLRPTIKSVTTERVNVAYDFDYVYDFKATKPSITTLPAVHIVE